jgi:MFS family permease
MFTNLIMTPLTVAHLTSNGLLVGLAMLPDALGAVVGASLGGKVVPRFGERAGMQGGGLIQAIGLFTVGWTMQWACVDGSSAAWGHAAARDGSGWAPALCAEVSGAALLLALACNAAIGLGLAANRVAATSYAVKCRPHARASVSAAQRFLQMLWAAVSSEKDAKLAQKLGQLQLFIAVFPQECMGQLVSFGPT